MTNSGPGEGETDETDTGGGCPKCGRRAACVGGLPAPMDGPELLGGGTYERFTVVKCTACGHSEFYSGRAGDRHRAVFYDDDPGTAAERATLREHGDRYRCSLCDEAVVESVPTCPGCGRAFSDRPN